MPLHPGSSDEVVSENISEMMHSGHPQKQAIAASLKKAGRSNKYSVNISPDGKLSQETSEESLTPEERDIPAEENEPAEADVDYPPGMPEP